MRAQILIPIWGLWARSVPRFFALQGSKVGIPPHTLVAGKISTHEGDGGWHRKSAEVGDRVSKSTIANLKLDGCLEQIECLRKSSWGLFTYSALAKGGSLLWYWVPTPAAVYLPLMKYPLLLRMLYCFHISIHKLVMDYCHIFRLLLADAIIIM